MLQSCKVLTATASATVYTGPCLLHGIVMRDADGGTNQIYDAIDEHNLTLEFDTQLGVLSAIMFPVPIALGRGLYFKTASTDCLVSFLIA